MSGGDYNNWITVLNDVARDIAVSDKFDFKDRTRLMEYCAKVLHFYAMAKGKLTEESLRKAEIIKPQVFENDFKAAYELFELVRSDPNIIKILDFHAGYSELKAHDLTDAVEELVKDEA